MMMIFDYKKDDNDDVHLDGIHARVRLHPLDTVLSLVWRQLPGKFNDKQFIKIFNDKQFISSASSSSCPDWNAFIQSNHSFIHTGSSLSG